MSLYLTHSYNVVKGDAELITVHFFLVWKDMLVDRRPAG